MFERPRLASFQDFASQDGIARRIVLVRRHVSGLKARKIASRRWPPVAHNFLWIKQETRSLSYTTGTLAIIIMQVSAKEENQVCFENVLWWQGAWHIDWIGWTIDLLNVSLLGSFRRPLTPPFMQWSTSCFMTLCDKRRLKMQAVKSFAVQQKMFVATLVGVCFVCLWNNDVSSEFLVLTVLFLRSRFLSRLLLARRSPLTWNLRTRSTM